MEAAETTRPHQLRAKDQVITQDSRTNIARRRLKRTKVSVQHTVESAREHSASLAMDLTWALLGEGQYTGSSSLRIVTCFAPQSTCKPPAFLPSEIWLIISMLHICKGNLWYKYEDRRHRIDRFLVGFVHFMVLWQDSKGSGVVLFTLSSSDGK